MLRNILALLVGVLPAFFLVFPTIFGDAAGMSDYVVPFLLIAAAYGLLGLGFGYWAKNWQVGLWAGAPAVLLLVLYSAREMHALLLHGLVAAIVLGPSVLGARGGSALRSARKA